jgi:hypothetical protein
VLVIPLLLLQNGEDASASVGAPTRSAAAPAVAAHRAPGHRRARPATGPAPVAVAIEAAPVRTVVPTTTTTTTTSPPVTTTTAPVPPTTTTTHPLAMALSGVRTTGQVTYYDHPAGRCASPWLPFGTVVTITNPANGATVTCVVDDREADTARSIDLATATFAELAPLSQGVVDARLSW